MSSDISLTAESWYGTQMKPDIFEPATAEWAGRAAKNAGWLFARQQEVLFSEGLNRLYYLQTPDLTFQQVFRRRFWLNEVQGTFRLRFALSPVDEELIVSGTLREGYGMGGWNQIGTCDGTYTSGGWKALYIYTDPDWHKTGIGIKQYAQLLVRGRVKPYDDTVEFSYLSLEAIPRT